MSEQALAHSANPEAGDDVSRLLYDAAKQSWENRPGAVIEMHPSFSGWRALRPNYKPADCFEGMGSDGIGTKVEVAERIQDHSTIAYDLFAMACDDAVVRGAEPVAINTVLDVNELQKDDLLTEHAIRDLASGYVAAAEAAGVVILNGETAELGNRVNGYGKFNYNWSGTVLWYAQQDRVLTGQKIQPGDRLIGLPDEGFRSNGISDVRAAMTAEYGEYWHHEIVEYLGSSTLGELVEYPSRIYAKLITQLTGGFDVEQEPQAELHGIAHITGGGQPEKLRRLLEPSGYGALIDNPIDVPDIMLEAQSAAIYSDEDAYSRWHMGPGMILAVPREESDTVLEVAEAAGYDPHEIGKVTESPGIRMRNCGLVGGAKKKHRWLKFEQ